MAPVLAAVLVLGVIALNQFQTHNQTPVSAQTSGPDLGVAVPSPLAADNDTILVVPLTVTNEGTETITDDWQVRYVQPNELGQERGVGWSISSAGCVAERTAARGPWVCTSDRDLAPGQSRTINLQLRMSFLTNGVTMTGGSAEVSFADGATQVDPNFSNDFVDSEFTTPPLIVNLRHLYGGQVGTFGNDPFSIGEVQTHEFSIANAPGTPANGITSTYTLPDDFVLNELPANCTGPLESPFTCTHADLITTGQTRRQLIEITPAPGATPGRKLNGFGIATSTGPSPESDPADNDFNWELEIEASGDLGITSTQPSIAAGGTGTSEITITNNGPLPDPGPISVSVNASNPHTFGTQPPGSPCSGGSTVLTCTFASGLAPGASTSFDLAMDVGLGGTAGSVITVATASVSSAEVDVVSSNNSTQMQITVAQATVDLQLSANSSSIKAGETGDVRFTTSNNGPDVAPDRTATFTVPSGLEFDVANLPAGCTGSASGPVTCVDGSLTNGGLASIDLPIRVPGSAPIGAGLSVDGTIATTANDTNSANDTASATITVAQGDADLALTADTPTIGVDSVGVHTLTVTNNGPADEPGPASVTYSPPTGVLIDVASLPTGCTGSLFSAQCDLPGPLAVGATQTIPVPVRVDAAAAPSSTISDGSATVTGTNDPVAPNNSITTSIQTGAARADLAATVDTPTIAPGATGPFEIGATNNGPLTDGGPITISFLPPSGSSIDVANLPAGCRGASAGVDCVSTTALATGESVTFAVPVIVPSSASGASLTGGSVSVSSPAIDEVAANNSVPAQLTLGAGSADLSVTTTTPTIAPGGTGTAQITASNAGPGNAEGPVTVTYTPPSGVEIASLPSGCTGPIPGGPISCTVSTGPLASGQAATVDVPLRLSASAQPGQSLQGTTTVSSPTPDPTPASNSEDNDVVVGAAAPADLDVSVTTPNIAPGESGTATVTAKNNGPGVAAGPITVNYTPPTGAEITALPNGCTGSIPAGPLTCSFPGPWNDQDQETIDIPLAVPAGATPQTLTGGGVDVSSPTPDPNPVNSQASPEVVVPAPTTTTTTAPPATTTTAPIATTTSTTAVPTATTTSTTAVPTATTTSTIVIPTATTTSTIPLPTSTTAVPTATTTTTIAAPTTAAPTTAAPTTAAPTTASPTTAAPTTAAPTTAAPTTAAPTTASPTTGAPTTAAPTTAAPTTAAPTTASPTTVAPTTAAPTTAVPESTEYDLQLTLDDTSTSEIDPGGVVELIGTIWNKGPATARETQLQIQIPAELAFNEAIFDGTSERSAFRRVAALRADLAPGQPISSCTNLGNVIVCQFGDMAPLQTASFTLRLQHDGSAGDPADAVSLRAEAIGADTEDLNNEIEVRVGLTKVATEAAPTPAPEVTNTPSAPPTVLAFTGQRVSLYLLLFGLALSIGGGNFISHRRRFGHAED